MHARILAAASAEFDAASAASAGVAALKAKDNSKEQVPNPQL